MKTLAITLIAAMTLGFSQDAEACSRHHAKPVLKTPVVRVVVAPRISPSEAAKIRLMKQRLAQYRARALRDGRLSRAERTKLNQLQSRLNAKTRMYRSTVG